MPGSSGTRQDPEPGTGQRIGVFGAFGGRARERTLSKLSKGNEDGHGRRVRLYFIASSRDFAMAAMHPTSRTSSAACTRSSSDSCTACAEVSMMLW
jgi:hypothetical protein